MTIVSRSRTAAAIVGAAMMLSGLSALADVGEPVHVKYRVSDAQNTQSAEILYKRIHLAAESVCSTIDHGDVASTQLKNACVEKVVADAVQRVNMVALSAVYAQKNQGPAPLITAQR